MGDEEDARRSGDFIEDDEHATARVAIAADKIRGEDLAQGARASLAERERKVIELRYGLGGDEPMTLEEVGHEFGVTRERIRQIESRALLKLKTARGGLEAYRQER